MPQSTIARIESGAVEPTLGTLNRVLLGLGEAATISAQPLDGAITASERAAVKARTPAENLDRAHTTTSPRGRTA